MRLKLRHKIIKLLKLFVSFSDEGEDKLLIQILMNDKKRIGTYLDIGAYHPWKVSNTFLLYLWGWSGTCVDINNKWKFKLLRHRDNFIYGYVGADTSYLFPKNLFTSSFNIAMEKTREWGEPKIKTNIPNIPADFADYDLLDLDVDGLDKMIIKKLLAHHHPAYILVEDKCLPEQKDIYEYLISEGYTRIANTMRNGIYKLTNN